MIQRRCVYLLCARFRSDKVWQCAVIQSRWSDSSELLVLCDVLAQTKYIISEQVSNLAVTVDTQKASGVAVSPTASNAFSTTPTRLTRTPTVALVTKGQ